MSKCLGGILVGNNMNVNGNALVTGALRVGKLENNAAVEYSAPEGEGAVAITPRVRSSEYRFDSLPAGSIKPNTVTGTVEIAPIAQSQGFVSGANGYSFTASASSKIEHALPENYKGTGAFLPSRVNASPALSSQTMYSDSYYVVGLPGGMEDLRYASKVNFTTQPSIDMWVRSNLVAQVTSSRSLAFYNFSQRNILTLWEDGNRTTSGTTAHSLGVEVQPQANSLRVNAKSGERIKFYEGNDHVCTMQGAGGSGGLGTGLFNIGGMADTHIYSRGDSNNTLFIGATKYIVFLRPGYGWSAYIEFPGTAPKQLNFTGQHRCLSESIAVGSAIIGRLVRSSGRYLNIDGTVKPSISESLPLVEYTTTAMDKAVFGVVSDVEESGGKREYAVGSFVTVFEKPDDEQRLIINSVGEGAVCVCSAGGNILNGDYLCSSDVPGIAMKQPTDTLHNYTVAKATSAVDFAEPVDVLRGKFQVIFVDAAGREVSEEERVYVVVLLGCTYHCG